MFGFRTLRFFGGALVLTLIATGNGEVVLAGARSVVSAAQQVLATVPQADAVVGAKATIGDESNTGEGAATTSGRAVSKHQEINDAVDHVDEFVFTRYEDGDPVRWCAAEIRILLNENGAPAGAVRDVRQALARISAASGIQLRVVGSTDEIANRSSYLRAGDPYPDVLVGWATPAQSDLLIEGASGVTVANPAQTEQGMRLVTGAVVFNANHDVLYRSGFGKGMTRGNLYLHELSHLLGLGHVDADGKLMATTIGSDTPAGLSAADRAGLRVAGSC